MRVVVDKWIATTLKQGDNRDESTSASDASSTYFFAQDTGLIRRRRRRRRKSETNKADLVIEQRVSTQQQLFQEYLSSSNQSLNNVLYDNDEKTFKKSDKNKNIHNFKNNASILGSEKEKIISLPIQFSKQTNKLNERVTYEEMSLKRESNFSQKRHCFTPTPEFDRLKSLNDILDESIYLNLNEDVESGNANNRTFGWQSFVDTLNIYLEPDGIRELISLVDEFIKLENYLNSEMDLNDKDLYFASQQEIIDTLNKSLKVKLFSLSQSTYLFNDLKKKFLIFLTNQLNSSLLKQTLKQFEPLRDDFFNLLESIKSKVKLKSAKLEKHLNTWNEFDSICVKLDELFNQTSQSNLNNLEYRSVLIDINNNLNKLKENLSYLASVCVENKYFEMKNLILVYELKFRNFKQLREEFAEEEAKQHEEVVNYQHNECQNNEEIIEENVEKHKNPDLDECRIRNCVICKSDTPNIRHRRGLFQQNVHYIVAPCCDTSLKRKETSDKCTFTIHDISTQTDLSDPNNNNTNSQTPKHNIYDHDYINKSHHHHHHHPTTTTESDGKKYLLEAYLRNNTENLLTGSSTSSSNKKGSSKEETTATTTITTGTATTTTTTTTRGESGIGTYNDEENESLHRNHDDSFTDYPENLLKDASSDNESSLNIKKERVFKRTKRSLSHREKLTELNLTPVKALKNCDASLLSSVKNNNKLVDKKFRPYNSTNTNSSSLLKKICIFLCFLFSLFFLFFVYFFYVNFLNPSCCDHKRNYLFLNIS